VADGFFAHDLDGPKNAGVGRNGHDPFGHLVLDEHSGILEQAKGIFEMNVSTLRAFVNRANISRFSF
jgi:hypothetical protein